MNDDQPLSISLASFDHSLEKPKPSPRNQHFKIASATDDFKDARSTMLQSSYNKPFRHDLAPTSPVGELRLDMSPTPFSRNQSTTQQQTQVKRPIPKDRKPDDSIKMKNTIIKTKIPDNESTKQLKQLPSYRERLNHEDEKQKALLERASNNQTVTPATLDINFNERSLTENKQLSLSSEELALKSDANSRISLKESLSKSNDKITSQKFDFLQLSHSDFKSETTIKQDHRNTFKIHRSDAIESLHNNSDIADKKDNKKINEQKPKRPSRSPRPVTNESQKRAEKSVADSDASKLRPSISPRKDRPHDTSNRHVERTSDLQLQKDESLVHPHAKPRKTLRKTEGSFQLELNETGTSAYESRTSDIVAKPRMPRTDLVNSNDIQNKQHSDQFPEQHEKDSFNDGKTGDEIKTRNVEVGRIDIQESDINEIFSAEMMQTDKSNKSIYKSAGKKTLKRNGSVEDGRVYKPDKNHEKHISLPDRSLFSVSDNSIKIVNESKLTPKKDVGDKEIKIVKGPMKATVPLANTTKNVTLKSSSGLHSRPLSDNSRTKSHSFTNISNIRPRSAILLPKDDSQLNASTLRDQIYLDWLNKKSSDNKKHAETKTSKQKEEEEKEMEKKERKVVSQKAFEAWSDKKRDDSKTKKMKLRGKETNEKEQNEEKMQRKLDAKKYFESWKNQKDDELKKTFSKKKREEDKKKKKEFSDKVERTNDAQKTFDNWKNKKDESLKEKVKGRKTELIKEKKTELEKQERTEKAKSAFEAWKETKAKSSRPSSATLTQRPWCPSSRNKAEGIPQTVNPVIVRSQPTRSRSMSASSRL